MIKFVEPKTLDDVIHKAMHCYEKNKSRFEEHHLGKGKSKGKLDQRKKGFKPHYKNQLKNVQHGHQAQGGFKQIVPAQGKPQEPIQCWGCGDNHMLKDFPHRKGNPRGLHNIEEVFTMEDMARETPRIYATLDDH